MPLLEITNTPFNYFPIVVQLIIAIGFVAVMMGVTHFLGPKRKTTDIVIIVWNIVFIEQNWNHTIQIMHCVCINLER